VTSESKLIGVVYGDEDDFDDDLRSFLPQDVAMWTEHFGTLPPRDEVEWLKAMAASPGIDDAALRLTRKRPGAIVFAVNSPSVIRGPEGAAEISRRLSASAGGVPAVTTSEAMVEAVRALGVRRLAVSVPYGPPVSDIVRAYFESYGIEVVGMHALDLPNANNWEALLVPDSLVLDMVRDADVDGADAIYVGCTSLRTAHLADDMERIAGKPVVTANGATMWQGLRLMGVRPERADRGALFRLTAGAAAT
jgi:maleate isomerase